MAIAIARLSDRQSSLLRALWAEGAHIPVISIQLSTGLLPGENKVTRNAVTTWRRKFDLPSRRTPRGMGILHRRGVDVTVPPLGRLPDPAIVARVFGAGRFEDAKVPTPRGRIGPAGPTRVNQSSSISLFEGMAS